MHQHNNERVPLLFERLRKWLKKHVKEIYLKIIAARRKIYISYPLMHTPINPFPNGDLWPATHVAAGAAVVGLYMSNMSIKSFKIWKDNTNEETLASVVACTQLRTTPHAKMHAQSKKHANTHIAHTCTCPWNWNSYCDVGGCVPDLVVLIADCPGMVVVGKGCVDVAAAVTIGVVGLVEIGAGVVVLTLQKRPKKCKCRVWRSLRLNFMQYTLA